MFCSGCLPAEPPVVPFVTWLKVLPLLVLDPLRELPMWLAVPSVEDLDLEATSCVCVCVCEN